MTLMTKDFYGITKKEGIVTIIFYGSGGRVSMTERTAELVREKLDLVLDSKDANGDWEWTK